MWHDVCNLEGNGLIYKEIIYVSEKVIEPRQKKGGRNE